MGIKIAPSLLAADFSRLGEEVRRAEEAGADWLHVDVMDGHFVPNLTMGPVVVEWIRKSTSMYLDVHLMVTDPDAYVKPFVDAGANMVSFHVEVRPDPRATMDRIRGLGADVGLVLNPDTGLEAVYPYVGEVDMVLLMSVFPGFGGQGFIPKSLERIRCLRAYAGSGLAIEVDGGIGVQNAGAVIHAGATILVAGTSTFRATDMREAIQRLRSGS